MQRIHSDDSAIESEIQAKGKIAPRITPADIEAVIASEHCFTAAMGVDMVDPKMTDAKMPPSLHLLTFCVLVLQNGFTVTGESACASPENFDYEIGCKIARQNAFSKIWALEGYLLREKLSAPVLNFKERVIDELEQLTAKVNALAKFITTPVFAGLDRAEKVRLEDQYGAMMTYAQILVRRIEAFEVQHHPV